MPLSRTRPSTPASATRTAHIAPSGDTRAPPARSGSCASSVQGCPNPHVSRCSASPRRVSVGREVTGIRSTFGLTGRNWWPRMNGASSRPDRLDRHRALLVPRRQSKGGTDVVLRRTRDRTVLREINVHSGADQRVRGDYVPATPPMPTSDPVGQPIQRVRLIRPQRCRLTDHPVEPPGPPRLARCLH